MPGSIVPLTRSAASAPGGGCVPGTRGVTAAMRFALDLDEDVGQHGVVDPGRGRAG